jgi:hypothetical protein
VFPQRLSRSRKRKSESILLAALLVIVALPAGIHSQAANGFTRLAALPALGGGRIWDVAINPASPAHMLVASDAGVYASTDSGGSWQPTLPGVRVWCVGFDIRNPQNAFAGTAGRGVIASSDGGNTWLGASNGLQNLDVRAFAFGLDGIGAGTDSGVALSPDGKTWHDGGLDRVGVSSVAVAANAPQFTLVAGADNGNLQAGSLYESNGSGWQVLQSGLPASAVVSAVASGPIDAAVPKRPLVVATSKGVFHSGDSGTTWTPSTGIAEQLTITTLTFSPLDPAVVYAGADAAGSSGGAFLRSVDGGQSFTALEQGLPSSKNVEVIATAPTNPLTVVVALDPPNGQASLYAESDTSLPPPPQLIAEAPGAAVPTVVATPSPTPRTSQAPSRSAASTQPPPGAFQRFVDAAFHWPYPLVVEIIFVLLVLYVIVRWRQRYYAEGPP